MDRPIPPRRRLQGLVAAALAALAMLSLPVLGPALLNALGNLVLFPEDRFSGLRIWWGGLMLYGGFGLPIALLFTLVVGWPAWRLLERRGLRSRRAAVDAGATAGAALALALTGLVFLAHLAEGGFRLRLPPLGAEEDVEPAPDLLALALALPLWGMFALWMMLSGAVAGWAAWRVATRGGSAPG